MLDYKTQNSEERFSLDSKYLKTATHFGNPNDEAYKLLRKAAGITDKNVVFPIANGEIDKKNDEENDWLDYVVKPTTAAEVDEMEELVNKATAALKKNDQGFTDCVSKLREIIIRSRKRHWEFGWRKIMYIIGFIIFMLLITNLLQFQLSDTENQLYKIEQWVEEPLMHSKDIESYAFFSFSNPSVDVSQRYESVTNYYNSKMNPIVSVYFDAKTKIDRNIKFMKEHKTIIGDSVRSIENETEKMENARDRFKKINDCDFEEIKKMALDEVKVIHISLQEKIKYLKLWSFFFLLLIPVYIFATRPHGYTIHSRYRGGTKNLGLIEKISLCLSCGILVVVGLTTGLIDLFERLIESVFVDNMTNLRCYYIVMMICCVILFVYNCFLMLYATITGLIHNYDWSAVKK